LARGDWQDCELPAEGPLFPRLSRLAYRMQETGRGQGETFQVRVARDTALAILGEPYSAPGVWANFKHRLRRLLGSSRPNRQQADALLKAGVDLHVLDEDEAQRQVQFYHQLLQEYFAARRLALTPDAKLVRTPWHITQVRPSLSTTLAQLPDSEPLSLLPSTGWEETMLLAAAMTASPEALVAELMAVNLALAGRCAAQPDVTITDELKAGLRRALIERTQAADADLRARIAAGLALGELGDPRFERRQGSYGAYLLPPLIDIAGGTYPLGSNEGNDDERPVHGVELTAFWMGQFLVTNAEWALFMAAGGYEDERWWATAEAQAWRRGEGTAEGPKQQTREFRQSLQANFKMIRELHQAERITSKQADDWEAIARMDDEAFEALLDDWYPAGRQTQPAYWNDEAFNNPAQPVVGICWYEARAYCAWLSAQTERVIRLPTEAEWEAAARGFESRRYAYGDDFDAARCNVFESHIRRTTPIGVFPGGVTPEGVVDLTGNVWEWTSSRYEPYPYRAEDGREVPGGAGRRVVRGGSWLGGQGGARATFRDRYLPASRDLVSGARLVVPHHLDC
jgi:formylglycine-generating enzyme required for sulfatase activity